MNLADEGPLVEKPSFFLSFSLHSGADPGEMKWVNFHPPFSEPPSFFFFLIPQILTSISSTRLWFYYIITKIHPPFQNPGFAPDTVCLFTFLIVITRKTNLAGSLSTMTKISCQIQISFLLGSPQMFPAL